MNKKDIKLLIIIMLSLIVIGPLIIHMLFKWYSSSYYIEAEWSAGEFLNYYGIIIGSIIGILGVFVTVKYAQKNYRDDIINQSLPFFALNILEKKRKPFDWFGDIDEIIENVEEGELRNKIEYKEYKARIVYFVLEGNEIIGKRSLPEDQRKTLENDGMSYTRGNQGEFIFSKKMVLSFPLELENVGKGAAINVRIGFNRKNSKTKKYLKPENIKTGDSYYVNIFTDNLIDDMVGEYILDITYEDIYQNGYNQFYEVTIEKIDIGYSSNINYKSNQNRKEK